MKLLNRLGINNLRDVAMWLCAMVIWAMPAVILHSAWSLDEKDCRIEGLEREIAKDAELLWDAHVSVEELQWEVDLLNEEAYALNKLLVDAERKCQ